MTASILAVVLGAIFSLSETTAKLAPNDEERTLVVEEARAALTQMTRDTREATSAVASPSGYSLTLAIRGTTVTYDCGVDHPSITGRSRCTRAVGTGTPAVVADHLLNELNSQQPFIVNDSYVRLRLQIAATGDRKDGHKATITLDDAAFVRNAAP